MPEVPNEPRPGIVSDVNSAIVQTTAALAPVVDSLLDPEPVVTLIGVPGS
jgi:hypothetical protein